MTLFKYILDQNKTPTLYIRLNIIKFEKRENEKINTNIWQRKA